MHSTTQVAKLPKEIFSMVLELAVGDGDVITLRSICLTCHSWYSLAKSLPRLWTALIIDATSEPARFDLWIQRSRTQPLSVVLPMRDFVQDQTLNPKKLLLGAILLKEYQRWRTAVIDCMSGIASLRRGWLAAIESREATLLEEFTLKWSGEPMIVPSTSTFPRLRTAMLGRMACLWAPVMLRNTPVIASLTIDNVELSHEFTISKLLEGLAHAPTLQELCLDEITWGISLDDPDNSDLILLPKLRNLSLTALSAVQPLVCALRLPALVQLVIGDVTEDLSPTFRHIGGTSSEIGALSTGLWDCRWEQETEEALSFLVAKQGHLQSLVVTDARITDVLLSRLTVHGDRTEEAVAPQLQRFEVSTDDVSSEVLLSMVRSRDKASSGQSIKRLKNLLVSGKEMPEDVYAALFGLVEELEVVNSADDDEKNSDYFAGSSDSFEQNV